MLLKSKLVSTKEILIFHLISFISENDKLAKIPFNTKFSLRSNNENINRWTDLKNINYEYYI